MEKYLGIIQLFRKTEYGEDMVIISKFSNDLNIIKNWVKLYPDSNHTILENNEELDSIFRMFSVYEIDEKKEEGKVMKKEL